jgi:hypothetical protein
MTEFVPATSCPSAFVPPLVDYASILETFKESDNLCLSPTFVMGTGFAVGANCGGDFDFIDLTDASDTGDSTGDDEVKELTPGGSQTAQHRRPPAAAPSPKRRRTQSAASPTESVPAPPTTPKRRHITENVTDVKDSPDSWFAEALESLRAKGVRDPIFRVLFLFRENPDHWAFIQGYLEMALSLTMKGEQNKNMWKSKIDAISPLEASVLDIVNL